MKFYVIFVEELQYELSEGRGYPTPIDPLFGSVS